MLDSCRVLQDEGFDVTYLPVKENGLIDLKQLEEAIRPDTCLVSVRSSYPPARSLELYRNSLGNVFEQIMMVNNEIGVIQPVKEIGEIVKKHKGVFFHTDAAQGVGKGAFFRLSGPRRTRSEPGLTPHAASDLQSPSMSTTSRPTSSRSRRTRSTVRRASDAFMCAGSRASGSSRSSRAEGRSAACGAEPCRCRWRSASERRAGSPRRRWR